MTRISDPGSGEPGSIAFASGPEHLENLRTGNPSTVVIPKSAALHMNDIPEGTSVVLSQNVKLAMALVAKEFFPIRWRQSYGGEGVHPKAVVDPTARIGLRVTIGPHSVVGRNVIIGDDVFIGPNSVVEAGSTVGSGTYLHAQVYIAYDTHIGHIAKSSSIESWPRGFWVTPPTLRDNITGSHIMGVLFWRILFTLALVSALTGGPSRTP
ncbi:MAG: hypothetical protein IPK68_15130 [Bdellovibrionales bacterium]|nr:hypothetical protein [Bdellovibrionales bacterium]